MNDKTKIFFTIITTLLIVQTAFSQNKKNVIIKYKKHESFDLGSVEIKGKIIAPGDLSIKERKRTRFSRSLFERDNFDNEIRTDINNLR